MARIERFPWITAIRFTPEGETEIRESSPLRGMLIRCPWKQEEYRVVDVCLGDRTMVIRQEAGGPLEDVPISSDWFTCLNWPLCPDGET